MVAQQLDVVHLAEELITYRRDYVCEKERFLLEIQKMAAEEDGVKQEDGGTKQEVGDSNFDGSYNDSFDFGDNVQNDESCFAELESWKLLAAPNQGRISREVYDQKTALSAEAGTHGTQDKQISDSVLSPTNHQIIKMEDVEVFSAHVVRCLNAQARDTEGAEARGAGSSLRSRRTPIAPISGRNLL